jgi:hypothetical protein
MSLSPRRERGCLPHSKVHSSAGSQCGDSVCGEVLHKEEFPEEGDRGGCAGASTSFVAGGAEMSFSGEGETDLPFLPDGAGTPFGQGVPGTRGLFAVFAGARTDRVLSRELSGALLELFSALEDTAEGFKQRRRSNQWVGNQNQHNIRQRMHVRS